MGVDNTPDLEATADRLVQKGWPASIICTVLILGTLTALIVAPGPVNRLVNAVADDLESRAAYNRHVVGISAGVRVTVSDPG